VIIVTLGWKSLFRSEHLFAGSPMEFRRAKGKFFVRIVVTMGSKMGRMGISLLVTSGICVLVTQDIERLRCRDEQWLLPAPLEQDGVLHYVEVMPSDRVVDRDGAAVAH
jgi:hypothetical protein